MLRVPMRSTSFVVALFVWMQLGLVPIAAAQPAPAARPTIQTVTIPDGSGLLIITGTGFGPSPAVTVEGQPVTVLPGGSDTQLTVLAPAAVLTTPGTYRLTVTDPVRQVADAFVVASHPALAPPASVTTGGTTVAPSGTDVAPGQSRSTRAASVPVSGNGAVVPLIVEDGGAPWTTAVGYQAAFHTTGTDNTASGWEALYTNSTGSNNTASGSQALFSNTTGNSNSASGFAALFSNRTGANNTASGFNALFSNTTGPNNTASGWEALFANTTGANNTASGYEALFSNKTGGGNTASGYQALRFNTAGANTAIGDEALRSNTTGGDNTALGSFAGFNATTGAYNVFLGANVLGTSTDTNTIRIGLPYDGTNGQNQTFVAGIYGTALPAGGGFVPVYINAAGQLGTALPSPNTSGGSASAPPPTAASGPVNATVAQLQQQVADLTARLAQLEALLKATVGRQ